MSMIDGRGFGSDRHAIQCMAFQQFSPALKYICICGPLSIVREDTRYRTLQQACDALEQTFNSMFAGMENDETITGSQLRQAYDAAMEAIKNLEE